MNSKLISVSAFVLVLLGLIATLCVFAFQDGIREIKWIDAEAAALGSMIICLVGAVLGWVSCKTSTGKVAGILGTLIVAFYLIVWMNGSQPSASDPPKMGTDAPRRLEVAPTSGINKVSEDIVASAPKPSM